MSTTDDYDEDRRLREMGINPDGDPIDIILQVQARYKALYGDDGLPLKAVPPIEETKKAVDEGDEPR